jgi:hypothetical protein
MAAETPKPDTNMAPAPAATAAPMTPAEAAPAPAAQIKVDEKEQAAPPATTASIPDDNAKVINEKPAAIDRAPAPKRADVHHAKYHNGEGSTWKTGRNSYGFEGSYGGCQFRGHAGPNGYHIDKAC